MGICITNFQTKAISTYFLGSNACPTDWCKLLTTLEIIFWQALVWLDDFIQPSGVKANNDLVTLLKSHKVPDWLTEFVKIC